MYFKMCHRCSEAVSKPRKEYIPRAIPRVERSSPSHEKIDGLFAPKSSLTSSRGKSHSVITVTFYVRFVAKC